MGTITGKSGGLGAKVRGTVQAKTVSGTKNAPKGGKAPGKVTFGPKNPTPSGKGKAVGPSTFSATSGTAVKPKGGFGGKGKAKPM